MFLLIVLAVLGFASAFPSSTTFGEPTFSVNFPSSAFSAPSDDDISGFIMSDMSSQGKFVNMDVDGITSEQDRASKKHEKLPMMKKQKEFALPFKLDEIQMNSEDDFDSATQQPGVAPKLTGTLTKTGDSRSTEEPNMDYFNFGEESPAVVNPSATFLEGGEFDKVQPPKCHFSGCVGPVANDGSLNLEKEEQKGSACHQTFVPMNSCTDNKGYPMGMICSICCECSSDFVREMKKTTGFLTGYNS